MKRPDPQLDRPRRILVAGEFRSGKSTVINLLMRRPVIEFSLMRADRPMLRLRHGSVPKILIVRGDGEEAPAATLEAAYQDETAVEVVLEAPDPVLQRLSITEARARVGATATAEWRQEAEAADLIIWCSIASQAWRHTERVFVESLGEDLAARSVLALTRSDLFASAMDREKVAQRMQDEAMTSFSSVAFVSAPASLVAAAGDARAWDATGISEIGALIPDVATQSEAQKTADEIAALATQEMNDRELSPSGPTLVIDNTQPDGGMPAPESLAPKPSSQPSTLSTDNVQAPVADIPAESIDPVLDAIAELRGFHSAAIVTAGAGIMSHSRSAGSELIGRGLTLFRNHRVPDDGPDDGREFVVTGPETFHILRAITPDAASHVHVVGWTESGMVARWRMAVEKICDAIAQSE